MEVEFRQLVEDMRPSGCLSEAGRSSNGANPNECGVVLDWGQGAQKMEGQIR
jgi:hypothetical protein